MSEESKSAEGDYVIMGKESVGRGGSSAKYLGVDDPSLTQEEKDHRLAMTLQQQENVAAYQDHKKKHDANVKAKENRTSRSETYTRLVAVRKQDHGALSVPEAYSSEDGYKKDGYSNEMLVAPPPGAPAQVVEDYKLAMQLQKVEQIDAGTVRTMEKIVTEEIKEDEAQSHRTERSNYHINQKGLFKHK